MLHSIVLASSIQQHESAISIHMFPPPYLLPGLIPPSVFYSNFPLSIYFTYGNIYVSMLLSQFIPLSPFFSVSKIYSLCLCLYSCPAKRFISIIFFFRFHIYALMYDIYFSLPELLHSVYNRF